MSKHTLGPWDIEWRAPANVRWDAVASSATPPEVIEGLTGEFVITSDVVRST